MAVVQIASATGFSVTFGNPVTADNVVLLLAGNMNGPGSFEGNGGAFCESGYLQTGEQSPGAVSQPIWQLAWVLAPAVGGEQTFQVVGAGNDDLIAIEFTDPNPTYVVDVTTVSHEVSSSSTPSVTSTEGGELDIIFDHSDVELLVLFCTLDSGTFLSATSGWTLVTQGTSALMYRLATIETDPSQVVIDAAFTLSTSSDFTLYGVSLYTTGSGVTTTTRPMFLFAVSK